METGMRWDQAEQLEARRRQQGPELGLGARALPNIAIICMSTR
jgi:hypothetical protein